MRPLSGRVFVVCVLGVLLSSREQAFADETLLHVSGDQPFRLVPGKQNLDLELRNRSHDIVNTVIPLIVDGNVGCGLASMTRSLVRCTGGGMCERSEFDIHVPLAEYGTNEYHAVWYPTGASYPFVAANGSTPSAHLFSRRVERLSAAPGAYAPPEVLNNPDLSAGPPKPRFNGSESELWVPRFTNTTDEILVRDCKDHICVDADRDGLNDAWENTAIQLLSPAFNFDSDENLIEDGDNWAVISSVRPLYNANAPWILISHVVAFEYDYGDAVYGIDSHDGDTEEVWTVWKNEGNHTIRWVATAAKGHVGDLPPFGTPTPTLRYGYRQQFSASGRPVIIVESDKHGLWATLQSCHENSSFRGSISGDDETCGSEVLEVIPKLFNVGDADSQGLTSRALIDSLEIGGNTGAATELQELFPNEYIWSDQFAQTPGNFCGGHQPCGGGASAVGNVLEREARTARDYGWGYVEPALSGEFTCVYDTAFKRQDQVLAAFVPVFDFYP